MAAKRSSLILGMILSAGIGAATMVLAQRDPTPESTKSALAIKGVFQDVVKTASKATVTVRVQDEGPARQAAFGTIVSPDGYILTKGSEVLGHTKVMVTVVQKTGITTLTAKIVGYSEALDLAMLKIDARDLKPVEFADTRPPETAPATATAPGRGARGGRGAGGQGGFGRRGTNGTLPAVATVPAEPPAGAVRVDVGEWVVTPDVSGSVEKDLAPASVGVISVTRRTIPAQAGYLGVMLEDSPDGGARIAQVYPRSAADTAGLKLNDIVTSVNGTPVRSRVELQLQLRRLHMGAPVTLTVVRGTETLTLSVVLGDAPATSLEEQEYTILSGKVNSRASDFPAVLQHDTVLAPYQVGGPLVDLEGHVLGINIARAGRTETFAIPADLIVPLIDPLKSGKLAPVNGNTPSTNAATNAGSARP